MNIPTPASLAAVNRQLESRRAATFGVLRDMHRGNLTLQAQHVNGRLHWYLSNGKTVAAETAELVIRRPEIIPMNDGLFLGFSQTYKLNSK
jgi:hypothetical protein